MFVVVLVHTVRWVYSLYKTWNIIKKNRLKKYKNGFFINLLKKSIWFSLNISYYFSVLFFQIENEELIIYFKNDLNFLLTNILNVFNHSNHRKLHFIFIMDVYIYRHLLFHRKNILIQMNLFSTWTHCSHYLYILYEGFYCSWKE